MFAWIVGGFVVLGLLSLLVETFQSWQRKRLARTLQSTGLDHSTSSVATSGSSGLRRRHQGQIDGATLANDETAAREKQQELIRITAEEMLLQEEERLRPEREDRERRQKEAIEKGIRMKDERARAIERQQESISRSAEKERMRNEQETIARESRKQRRKDEAIEKESDREKDREGVRERQQEEVRDSAERKNEAWEQKKEELYKRMQEQEATKKSKRPQEERLESSGGSSIGFVDRTSTTHSLLSLRLDAERRLKEQQDREYALSLQEDKMKDQLEEETKNKLKEKEKLKKQRLARYAQLPVEPVVDETKYRNIAYLRFRLFDGTTFERRFLDTDTLQHVFDYVEGQAADALGEEYRLVSHFPHRTHTDPSLTLAAAGLFPRIQLFIEEPQ